VYDGDRQAPTDLSNLLPDKKTSDPDTWLMRHESMLAFLHQIFSPICFLKESIHIYKILQVLNTNKFPPNIRIVHRLRYLGEIKPKLEKPQLGKILLYLLHCKESYAMHTPFLNGRSFILILK
jgi:hypothetical protein